jgi:hypothetical protein
MSSKSLSNQTPSQSYKDLIHTGNSGQGVKDNLSPLYDGSGKELPLSISKNQVSINCNGGSIQSPVINGFYEKFNIASYPRSNFTFNINSPENFIVIPSITDPFEIVPDGDPYDAYSESRWSFGFDGVEYLELKISFIYEPSFLSNFETNEFMHYQSNLMIMNSGSGYRVLPLFLSTNQIKVTSDVQNNFMWPQSPSIHTYKIDAFIDGKDLKHCYVKYIGMLTG